MRSWLVGFGVTLALGACFTLGAYLGERAAIGREYDACVHERGVAPEHQESCGSIIGAEHGEKWRAGWP